MSNERLRKRIDDAGFDVPIESPIIKSKVSESILPLINERQNIINEKVAISYQQDIFQNLSIL